MTAGATSRVPLAPLARALVVLAAAATGASGGCGTGVIAAPYVFDDPEVETVTPVTLVPGSRLVVTGARFVPADIGQTWLRLRGTFGGQPVDLRLAARFVDYGRVEADFDGAAAVGLPTGEGTFAGDAIIEIDNLVDGRTHSSRPLGLSLEVRGSLAPRLDLVVSGPVFVNDAIVVHGDGLLLGGAEGTTVAEVSGCFRPQGASTCAAVGPIEVPVAPEQGTNRTRGAFAFAPGIAGIRPGTLENGVVQVRNRHGLAAGGAVISGNALTAAWDLQPPTVFGLSPATASLGQYVAIDGGGFVGAPAGAVDPNAVTSFELTGAFVPEGGGGRSVSLAIIGEWVSGRLVRYVLNEEDELGQAADLRGAAGRFTGTIKPVVVYGGQTMTGAEVAVALDVGHVRQVVWLNFQPSYVESLRHFGLRAVDQQVRDRVLTVARRDYAAVNVDFRLERPTDFALFSQVDIQGPDSNRLGLLGYDNTFGKDVGNQRLHDKIGGDNALTREDGYPGYGGVFVESLFGFSEHPGTLAARIPTATTVFDQLFDPFRPDCGGQPITAAELAAIGMPAPTPGGACPAPTADRPRLLACAVWALGSLIGTTLTHEIGHSLGLADPMGNGFHDVGDRPNRLMDASPARTFNERAETNGEGPGVFCDQEYEYLRRILPSAEAPPAVTRPPCN